MRPCGTSFPATHRDLAVAQGTFREDPYTRLKVVHLQVVTLYEKLAKHGL